jgi:hypothetical protein
MKITGIPGVKNMVIVFDPDDIEKVRVYKWRILGLQLASCWWSVQIHFTTLKFFQILWCLREEIPSCTTVYSKIFILCLPDIWGIL